MPTTMNTLVCLGCRVALRACTMPVGLCGVTAGWWAETAIRHLVVRVGGAEVEAIVRCDACRSVFSVHDAGGREVPMWEVPDPGPWDVRPSRSGRLLLDSWLLPDAVRTAAVAPSGLSTPPDALLREYATHPRAGSGRELAARLALWGSLDARQRDAVDSKRRVARTRDDDANLARLDVLLTGNDDASVLLLADLRRVRGQFESAEKTLARDLDRCGADDVATHVRKLIAAGDCGPWRSAPVRLHACVCAPRSRRRFQSPSRRTCCLGTD